MIRRLLAATLVLAVLGPPLVAGAQRAGRVPRIGYLTPTSQPAREAAFRDALLRLGHEEGRSIAIEYRSAEARFERLPALAAELAGRDVDVIVAVVTEAALAAQRATRTIPIVMVGVADPVGTGLVASLARPGGNVTGTSAVAADVVGKQLELLDEVLPKASRVAVLWNPANRVFQARQLREARAAATKLRLRLHLVEVRTPDELDGAFAALPRLHPDALLLLNDPLFHPHASRIAALATSQRLPAVSGARDYAEAGILVTYGPDYPEAWRRAATYVDRILNGRRPGELPVEQTTRFELVVNARTARVLGLTIPASVTARADHVVE
jgi:putative ABC transport system substrate-binding protein